MIKSKVVKSFPRPWRVDPCATADILDANGNDVATTWTPNGTGLLTGRQRAAMARLIVRAVNALKE